MSENVSPYVARGPVAHEIHALRLATIINNITVLLLAMFTGFYVVQAVNRLDTTAATAAKIQALQQTQADNSANGRAILLQQAALSKVIADQTSPTATARQQAAVAGYLQSLTDAQKTLNADLLHKMGQLAQCVPCSPAAVSRILAEPVPVITFGPPTPTPSPTPRPIASSAPTPTRSVTVSPSPSRSPFLQVQCPVICPQPPK